MVSALQWRLPSDTRAKCRRRITSIRPSCSGNAASTSAGLVVFAFLFSAVEDCFGVGVPGLSPSACTFSPSACVDRPGLRSQDFQSVEELDAIPQMMTAAPSTKSLRSKSNGAQSCQRAFCFRAEEVVAKLARWRRGRDSTPWPAPAGAGRGCQRQRRRRNLRRPVPAGPHGDRGSRPAHLRSRRGADAEQLILRSTANHRIDLGRTGAPWDSQRLRNAAVLILEQLEEPVRLVQSMCARLTGANRLWRVDAIAESVRQDRVVHGSVAIASSCSWCRQWSVGVR